ncbi:MAG: hypothetical protein NWF09_09655 [Candidatus Bathyarchaeota archaeon]|nr:hypothetical protein [Candidatus Bathyarchaeota archaeon]
MRDKTIRKIGHVEKALLKAFLAVHQKNDCIPWDAVVEELGIFYINNSLRTLNVEEYKKERTWKKAIPTLMKKGYLKIANLPHSYNIMKRYGYNFYRLTEKGIETAKLIALESIDINDVIAAAEKGSTIEDSYNILWENYKKYFAKDEFKKYLVYKRFIGYLAAAKRKDLIEKLKKTQTKANIQERIIVENDMINLTV